MVNDLFQSFTHFQNDWFGFLEIKKGIAVWDCRKLNLT